MIWSKNKNLFKDDYTKVIYIKSKALEDHKTNCGLIVCYGNKTLFKQSLINYLSYDINFVSLNFLIIIV